MSILVLFCATVSAEPRLVSVETRPGVTVRWAWDEPQEASATVVLFEGGSGRIRLDALLQASGDRRAIRGFVSGQWRRFVRHGLAVAVVDAPSDRREYRGGMAPRFRESPSHLADLDAVLRWVRRQRPVRPVWLVGISMGTLSAARYGLHGRVETDGMVLLSSIVRHRSGVTTVPGLGLESYRSPLLLVAHTDDGCVSTPPDGARSIAAMATRTTVTRVEMVGGGDAPGDDPCRPGSHHTFHGVEQQVVGSIARFIADNAR